MPVSKKQLGRLIRLVAQLKENRYPNCSSFAETMRLADIEENLNLACTPKTIQRDLLTLKNDFGAPIAYDGTHKGYYLTRRDWNFTCPQIFDDSCMVSAVLGARVAEHIFPAVMKKEIRNAVDFLLTHNNPDFLDKTQVDSLVVIPSNRTKIDGKIFMPLFYAWQNHEVCHINYLDSKGNASERDFEPHTLVFFDGVWYSKGFCRTRKEIRTLAIVRMKSVVPTGKHFSLKSKIVKTANEEGIFDPEIVKDVVVRCDEYLANMIQTHPLHPEQKVTTLASGDCELHVKAMSKYRLITWIMHQCGRAEILAPKSMREEISSFAEKIQEKHS